MGLVFTILFAIYMYWVPGYWFPALTTMPIPWILSTLAILTSIPRLLMGRGRFVSAPQVVFFMAFCVLAILSRTWNGWFGGMFVTLIDLLPTILLFFLVLINADTLNRQRVLVAVLMLMAVLLVLMGMRDIERGAAVDESPFVFMQRVENPQNPNDVTYIYRLKGQGIIDDPNDCAQFLMVILALSWLWWGQGFLGSILVAASSVVILYGVYLTRSRGALVGLIVMFMVAGRRKMKTYGFLALAAAGGLILIAGRFAGGRAVSLQGGADRLAIWSDALGALKTNPLFGLGYKSFADEFLHTAHNSAILVATEIGMIGLIIWVAMYVVSFDQLKQTVHPPAPLQPDPGIQRHAKALEAALVAYLTTSWFLSRAYQPTSYILLGMTAGLAYFEYVRTNGRSAPQSPLLPRLSRWSVVSAAIAIGGIVLIYVLVRLRAI